MRYRGQRSTTLRLTNSVCNSVIQEAHLANPGGIYMEISLCTSPPPGLPSPCFLSARRLRRPDLHRLRALYQADDITFRVGKLSKCHHVGDLRHRNDYPAAETDRTVQIALRILNFDVKRRVRPGIPVDLSDAAVDPLFQACVYKAVLHRVIRIDIPAEQRTIEFLSATGIFSHHFEMNNRFTHILPPRFMIVSRLLRPFEFKQRGVLPFPFGMEGPRLAEMVGVLESEDKFRHMVIIRA